MLRTRLSVAAVLAPIVLASCTLDQTPAVSAASEISRLQSLGYNVVARGGEGDTTILRYSGAINGSVECGQNNQMQSMQPRVVSANGAVQDFTLNSFLVLSPGDDGVLRSGDRDGLYVVSKLTRPSARARATDIETITFEPGDRATFTSGLSCRAT